MSKLEFVCCSDCCGNLDCVCCLTFFWSHFIFLLYFRVNVDLVGRLAQLVLLKDNISEELVSWSP